MSNQNNDTTTTEPAKELALATGSAGWVRGDAPRDGNLYIAIGRIVGSDEWGGHSTPFLSHVRWHCDADWGGWVDEQGLAISSDIDDRVYIDHWIALPNAANQRRLTNNETSNH